VNDSITAQARQQTLGDLPRRTARRFPDKPALVDGDTRLSFAELDAVVDRTAEAYRRAVDETAGSTPVAQENKGDEPTC
jgi:fatty-acyl-CoA synthase